MGDGGKESDKDKQVDALEKATETCRLILKYCAIDVVRRITRSKNSNVVDPVMRFIPLDIMTNDQYRAAVKSIDVGKNVTVVNADNNKAKWKREVEDDTDYQGSLAFHTYMKNQVGKMIGLDFVIVPSEKHDPLGDPHPGGNSLKYFNFVECYWLLQLLAGISKHGAKWEKSGRTKDALIEYRSLYAPPKNPKQVDYHLWYSDALAILNLIPCFRVVDQMEDSVPVGTNVMGSYGLGVLFLKSLNQAPQQFGLSFSHLVEEYLISAAGVLFFCIETLAAAFVVLPKNMTTLRDQSSEAAALIASRLKNIQQQTQDAVAAILTNNVFANLKTLVEYLRVKSGLGRFFPSLALLELYCQQDHDVSKLESMTHDNLVSNLAINKQGGILSLMFAFLTELREADMSLTPCLRCCTSFDVAFVSEGPHVVSKALHAASNAFDTEWKKDVILKKIQDNGFAFMYTPEIYKTFILSPRVGQLVQEQITGFLDILLDENKGVSIAKDVQQSWKKIVSDEKFDMTKIEDRFMQAQGLVYGFTMFNELAKNDEILRQVQTSARTLRIFAYALSLQGAKGAEYYRIGIYLVGGDQDVATATGNVSPGFFRDLGNTQIVDPPILNTALGCLIWPNMANNVAHSTFVRFMTDGVNLEYLVAPPTSKEGMSHLEFS